MSGKPEALAASFFDDTDVLYVAVSERGILASRDGGVTFAIRYAE